MAQRYNILEASPAGEVWKSSYGSELQTFFLKLENLPQTVMVNRKAGSPLLSGPTWLELTEAVSKKGNKYYKAKVVSPPDDATAHQQPQEPGQAVLPLGVVSDTISWSEAVLAASMAVTEPNVELILSLARDLFIAKAPSRERLEEAKRVEEMVFEKDIIPTEREVGEINLDDIPF